MGEAIPVFHSFLKSAIASYLEFRRSRGHAKNTALLHALEDFDYYLVFYGITEISQLEESLLVPWIHFLGSRRSARARNRRLSAIRGLFGYLMRTGVIQSNPAGNIPYLKGKSFSRRNRRKAA